MLIVAEKTLFVSSEVSLFDKLVSAGEEKAHITLPHQIRIFLVLYLTEHLCDTSIIHNVLALGLLNSPQRFGEFGNVELRRTGDAALLLAGFYPEWAHRLNVSPDYFRFMGQSAYASLAARLHATGKTERGRFYDEVAVRLRSLETVLYAAREREDLRDFFLRLKARYQ
jgi:hypothetical protein